MRCEPLGYRKPDGTIVVTGYACSRGRTHYCSTPGCHGRSVAQCDFPVLRKGKAGICDRHLCASCRRRRPDLGGDVDYCRVHDEATPNAQRQLPLGPPTKE